MALHFGSYLFICIGFDNIRRDFNVLLTVFNDILIMFICIVTKDCVGENNVVFIVFIIVMCVLFMVINAVIWVLFVGTPALMGDANVIFVVFDVVMCALFMIYNASM